MSSLGQRMREARERQGQELAAVAEQLCISPAYLEAIENDDVSALPGGFFSRSFYRQYVRFLGMDPDEVRAEVDQLLSGEATPLLPGQGSRKEGSDLPPLPGYSNRRQRRKLFSAVAALVGVVAGCAAMYQFWLSGEANPVPAPEAGGKVTVARAESSVEPAATVGPQASGDIPDGPLWLEIEADEEVWVQITAGGERVFQGLLQQSDSKQLSGLEEARVLVGNAGGLRIYWNGKPMGPIGERGQVRLVRLTPEGPRVIDPRRATPTSADENGSSNQS